MRTNLLLCAVVSALVGAGSAVVALRLGDADRLHRCELNVEAAKAAIDAVSTTQWSLHTNTFDELAKLRRDIDELRR